MNNQFQTFQQQLHFSEHSYYLEENDVAQPAASLINGVDNM